jgi:hypothetical protein
MQTEMTVVVDGDAEAARAALNTMAGGIQVIQARIGHEPIAFEAIPDPTPPPAPKKGKK